MSVSATITAGLLAIVAAMEPFLPALKTGAVLLNFGSAAVGAAKAAKDHRKTEDEPCPPSA